jgi:hypothetical protein
VHGSALQEAQLNRRDSRQLPNDLQEAHQARQQASFHRLPCREDLLDKARVAAAAYAKERRRNAELVRRLQQLHAEQACADQ